MMPVKQVILVQHGDKEREPGDPGLSRLGGAQVEATAEVLAALAVSAVYTSPLRRALETAEPIGASHGLSVRVDERLRERMNWTLDDYSSLAEFQVDWERASRDRTYVPRAGDSSVVAAARFREFLDEAATRWPASVVVTHGGVTVDLLRDLILDEELERRLPDVIDNGIPPCGLTRLLRDASTWGVIDIADTRHLATIS